MATQLTKYTTETSTEVTSLRVYNRVVVRMKIVRKQKTPRSVAVTSNGTAKQTVIKTRTENGLTAITFVKPFTRYINSQLMYVAPWPVRTTITPVFDIAPGT